MIRCFVDRKLLRDTDLFIKFAKLIQYKSELRNTSATIKSRTPDHPMIIQSIEKIKTSFRNINPPLSKSASILFNHFCSRFKELYISCIFVDVFLQEVLGGNSWTFR